MIKYIIRRLLLMVPVIVGISFIIFSIMSLTPGSPAKMILGDLASKESIEKLNEELGFNKPFLVRYLDYVKSALKGDFGRSYRTGLPVTKEIAQRFPTTVKLAFYSVLFSTIVGIPIGIISAIKQYSVIDSISSFSLSLYFNPAFLAWSYVDAVFFAAIGLVSYIWIRYTNALRLTCTDHLCKHFCHSYKNDTLHYA